MLQFPYSVLDMIYITYNRYSDKEILRAKQSADMAHAITAHTDTLQRGITDMTGTSSFIAFFFSFHPFYIPCVLPPLYFLLFLLTFLSVTLLLPVLQLRQLKSFFFLLLSCYNTNNQVMNLC